jgi:O-antigen ligase
MIKDRNRKKAYLYFLILFVFGLLSLLGFGLLNLNERFLIITFLSSALLLLAFFRLDWLLFFVILSLVFNRWLLTYQIDFGFLSQFFGVKELLVSPYTLIYGLIVFLFLVEFLSAPRKVFKAPLVWLIVLAVVFNGLSFWKAEYKLSGLNDWLYFLGFFAAYFLGFLRFNSPRDYLKLLIFLILAAIVPLFFAFRQLILGDFFYEGDSGLPRLIGSFFHPNTLGSFFLVAVTVSWALFLASVEGAKGNHFFKSSKLFFIVFLLFLVGMGFTFSRSSWIGAIVALLVVSFSRPWFKKFFLLGAVFLALTIFILTPLRQRVIEVFHPRMFDTLHSRFEIWDWALFAFRDHPWTGYGFGSFEKVVQEVRGYDSGNAYPHSDTVLFLTERGILGFLGYLFYMLGAIFYAFRGYLRPPLEKRRLSFFGKSQFWDFKVLGSIPLALFVAMVLVSLVESPVRDFTFQFLSWILLGSFLGFSRKKKKRATTEDPSTLPAE